MQELDARYLRFNAIDKGGYGQTFLVLDKLQQREIAEEGRDPLHLFQSQGAMATTTATNATNGAFYAVKKIQRGTLHQILREAAVMRRLYHRNIIQLLNVVPRTNPGSCPFLVMEYAPMDLRKFIGAFICDEIKEGSMWDCFPQVADHVRSSPIVSDVHDGSFVPLPYVQSLLHGILSALHHMHGCGMIHRDLKPENILVFPFGEGGLLPEILLGERRGQDVRLHPLLADVAMPLGVEELRGALHAMFCPYRYGTEYHKTHKCTAYGNYVIDRYERRRRAQRALGNPMGDEASELYEEALRIHKESEALRPLVQPVAKIADFGSSRPMVTNWYGGFAPPGEHAQQPSSEDLASVMTWMTDSDDVGGGSASSTMHPFFQANGIHTPHLAHLYRCGKGHPHYREYTADEVTTKHYRAPETFLGPRQYSKATDVWAVGCILFEFLTGHMLFPCGSMMNFELQRKESDDTNHYFILSMFRNLGRPTAEEWRAMAHPALYHEKHRTMIPCIGSDRSGGLLEVRRHALEYCAGAEGYALLRSLLAFHPLERMTSTQALEHPFFSLAAVTHGGNDTAPQPM